MQPDNPDTIATAGILAQPRALAISPERSRKVLELLARTNPVRLNIGAGNKVIEGWLSVGLEPHHDINADVRDLSMIPDNCADEAMAVHVLEHLWRWDAPGAIAEWFRVLKSGGTIALELPDAIKCCQNVAGNPKNLRNGFLGLFGDPAHCDPMMIHKHPWTPDEVIAELRAAGFIKMRQERPQFHGRRRYRDMRIEAKKP